MRGRINRRANALRHAIRFMTVPAQSQTEPCRPAPQARGVASSALAVAFALALTASALAVEPAAIVCPPLLPAVAPSNSATGNSPGANLDPDSNAADTTDVDGNRATPYATAQASAFTPRLGAAMRVGQRLLEAYTRTADQTQRAYLDDAADGPEQRVVYTRVRDRTRTVKQLDPLTGGLIAWDETISKHRMAVQHDGRNPSESTQAGEGLTLPYRIVDGWARIDENVLMPDAQRRELESPDLPLPCFPVGKPLKPGLRWEFDQDDARLMHYRPGFLVTDASVRAELTRLVHRHRAGDAHVFVGPLVTVYLSASGRLVRDTDNDGVADEADTTELNYTQSMRLDIDLGLNLIVATHTDGSATFTFASGARETRGTATLTLDATWQPIVDEQTEQAVRDAMARVAARKAAAEAEAALQDE